MIDSYITSRPELFVLEQGGEVYGWADRPVELPCRVNQLAGRNVSKLIWRIWAFLQYDAINWIYLIKSYQCVSISLTNLFPFSPHTRRSNLHKNIDHAQHRFIFEIYKYTI